MESTHWLMRSEARNAHCDIALEASEAFRCRLLRYSANDVFGILNVSEGDEYSTDVARTA